MSELSFAPRRRRILLPVMVGVVMLLVGAAAGFYLDIYTTEQAFHVPCPPASPEESGLQSTDYVGAGNSSPHAIDHPLAYPRVGELANLEGTVLLQVFVRPDGHVGEAHLIRSSGFCPFDVAALKAVMDWRYQPALQGGKPAGTWWLTNVAFKIPTDSGDASPPATVVPPT